jgi:hypothetical protein
MVVKLAHMGKPLRFIHGVRNEKLINNSFQFRIHHLVLSLCGSSVGKNGQNVER